MVSCGREFSVARNAQNAKLLALTEAENFICAVMVDSRTSPSENDGRNGN